jgi:Flp pilus assembly pilin Flp
MTKKLLGFLTIEMEASVVEIGLIAAVGGLMFIGAVAFVAVSLN